MAINRMWMVRSDAGRLFEDFRNKGIVAVGWSDLGDVKPGTTRQDIEKRLIKECGYTKPTAALMAASQVWKFLNEIQVGDGVITYDPSTRVYLVGEVKSSPMYDEKIIAEDTARIRKVSWLGEVKRDALNLPTRNSLGSTLTLFEVPEHAVADVRAKLGAGGEVPPVAQTEPPPVEQDAEAAFTDLEAKGRELTKDKVGELDWQDMQELVAGILRGMGYKTQVSPSGPDRGKDIIASPDGFGFENPRIVVEVKHRTGAMGSKEVRGFLGGRHKDDRGLFVSTGGFTKDAYYEAERASIPLALWDLSDLARALSDNYEKLDVETKRLVPLRKLYWPA